MEINEFALKICKAVEKELGDSYRTELKAVRKNNGVLLHGLLIMPPGRNVTPTIYLETFHAAYEDGVPFAEVLGRILEIFREETPGKNIDMDFFRFYEKVKDRICFRLINRRSNEELLQDIPHVEFLDLAICFYYACSGGMLGEGTILIHNSHMERWQVKTKDLMKQAMGNTPRLFPGILTSMQEVLEEIAGPQEDFSRQEIPLTVLTNTRRIQGAACILYPGMLERIGAGMQDGFYIIPSSIHEVLIMEKTGLESPGEMKRIIYEVNREHVASEEVLSDNLYYYDSGSGRVGVVF